MGRKYILATGHHCTSHDKAAEKQRALENDEGPRLPGAWC